MPLVPPLARAVPVSGVGASAPLTPSPDEARRMLEVELLRPEYQEHVSVLDRLLAWVSERIGGLDGAPLPVGAVVVVGLLVALLALAAWRVRDVRAVAAQRRRREKGLADPGRDAASYRDEARRELARGAVDRAAVAAFRGLVVELDDAGLVLDAPGRTAREVAREAATALPTHAEVLRDAAASFDSACYGNPEGPVAGPGDRQRLAPRDAEAVLALAGCSRGAGRVVAGAGR